MAYSKIKAEHGGAKHAKGAWTTKQDAKQSSKKIRRAADKKTSRDY